MIVEPKYWICLKVEGLLKKIVDIQNFHKSPQKLIYEGKGKTALSQFKFVKVVQMIERIFFILVYSRNDRVPNRLFQVLEFHKQYFHISIENFHF